MKHAHVDEWYTAYLEGSLPDQRRRDVEEHLRACPRCAAALAELRQLVAQLHRLPETVPPPDFVATVRARRRQRRPSPITGWRFPLLAGSTLAAAAVLLVAIHFMPMITAPSSPPVPAVNIPPQPASRAAKPAPPNHRDVVVERVPLNNSPIARKVARPAVAPPHFGAPPVPAAVPAPTPIMTHTPAPPLPISTWDTAMAHQTAMPAKKLLAPAAPNANAPQAYPSEMAAANPAHTDEQDASTANQAGTTENPRMREAEKPAKKMVADGKIAAKPEDNAADALGAGRPAGPAGPTGMMSTSASLPLPASGGEQPVVTASDGGNIVANDKAPAHASPVTVLHAGDLRTVPAPFGPLEVKALALPGERHGEIVFYPAGNHVVISSITAEKRRHRLDANSPDAKDQTPAAVADRREIAAGVKSSPAPSTETRLTFPAQPAGSVLKLTRPGTPPGELVLIVPGVAPRRDRVTLHLQNQPVLPVLRQLATDAGVYLLCDTAFAESPQLSCTVTNVPPLQALDALLGAWEQRK